MVKQKKGLKYEWQNQKKSEIKIRSIQNARIKVTLETI